MKNHRAKLFVATFTWITGCVLVAAACGSSPQSTAHVEGSSSAIRAAEEVGVSESPKAALYLQLAKEEQAKGKNMEREGNHEEASLMFMQAQADGELALALSRSETERNEAQQSINNLQTLRQQNP